MNFKNILQKFLIFLLFIIPINTFAYSSYIIPGGQTIGIEVNSKGVLVVGFYKVDNRYIGRDAGFAVGDSILKVNGNSVENIKSMVNTINSLNTENIEFTVSRNNTEKKINLELKKDSEGVLKTGLYVKDQINGVGTLTYIDPKTNTFGALGHEILESTTAEKFEISDGKIFDAKVTGITKSRSGKAGEKNAAYDKSNVYGTIKSNDITGIFGKYTENYANENALEVGSSDNVRTGKASIRTVIKNNEVEDFEINILRLDDNSKTKNILFEITDEKLLNETGGVIQGMSGSPIIQDNKIIGAVNYVIVNDTAKGYGIFITTMLKEGDK